MYLDAKLYINEVCIFIFKMWTIYFQLSKIKDVWYIFFLLSLPEMTLSYVRKRKRTCLEVSLYSIGFLYQVALGTHQWGLLLQSQVWKHTIVFYINLAMILSCKQQ